MKSLIVALLFFVPSLLYAQPEGAPDNHPNGPPRFEGRMMDQLKLTDDQKSQVRTLQSTMMKKQIALRADIQTKRVELRDLVGADTPDQRKIEAKQKEISTLRGDLAVNRTDFWFGVNKILTPEQQKIWKRHARMAFAEGNGMRHGRMHSFAERMRRFFHDRN